MLGLCETCWNGTGQMQLTSGDTTSTLDMRKDTHIHGVVLLLTPEAAQALLSWEPSITKAPDGKVQLQGEESHRHPVLCTHQRSRDLGKGGILRTAPGSDG